MVLFIDIPFRQSRAIIIVLWIPWRRSSVPLEHHRQNSKARIRTYWNDWGQRWMITSIAGLSLRSEHHLKFRDRSGSLESVAQVQFPISDHIHFSVTYPQNRFSWTFWFGRLELSSWAFGLQSTRFLNDTKKSLQVYMSHYMGRFKSIVPCIDWVVIRRINNLGAEWSINALITTGSLTKHPLGSDNLPAKSLRSIDPSSWQTYTIWRLNNVSKSLGRRNTRISTLCISSRSEQRYRAKMSTHYGLLLRLWSPAPCNPIFSVSVSLSSRMITSEEPSAIECSWAYKGLVFDT